MTDERTKRAARSLVRRAVETGELIVPNCCQECGIAPVSGSDGRRTLQAHHYAGYTFAKAVRWLCPKCHFKHDPRPQGIANGRAKISEEVARHIRETYRPGGFGCRGRPGPASSARVLARQFGISARTVRRIANGEIWVDAALSEPQP